MGLIYYLSLIPLLGLGIFFLYFQWRIYKEQKELIENELKSLKKLRKRNLQFHKYPYPIQRKAS